MAARSAGINRRVVHRLVAGPIDPHASDRDLLHRFAGQRDEAAFEVLVRRHGVMVLAVGRRVLGNTHDAEDVCQATFLLLARKAASQRWQPSVANWLHQTARRLALKAHRAAARRSRHEGKAAVRTPANPLAEMTGQDLLAVLDAELLALPEPLRAPLVLCYLEGMTRDEAADRLGCPLSTLKKRLERGRDRLHAALARRGLPAALLGTLLAGRSDAGLPAAAVRATAQAAGGGATSPGVRQLVHGGTGMTGWKKIGLGLATLLAGGLLSAAAVDTGGHEPTPPPNAKVTAPAAKAEPPAPARSIRVVVLDPEGKPVPRARVLAVVGTDEPGSVGKLNLETDAAGAVRVVVPRSATVLILHAFKEPFAALRAFWERIELLKNEIPTEYTFRLPPGVTGGGRIVDEVGRPVPGARVEVYPDRHGRPAC